MLTLRCVSGRRNLFSAIKMKGDLGDAGQRSRASLRRWPEKTEPFRVPQMKVAFFGRRRRGRCFAGARSGSDFDVSHSFDLSSVRVESPLSRVQRVTAALHGHHNACDTHHSQNSYQRAWCLKCFEFGEFGGRQKMRDVSLCSWEQQSRCVRVLGAVRRSAVDESAHAHQAPLKLDDETWAGLMRNQGLRFSQEEGIVPVCAVALACPSCPDRSSEPPGPGRKIRNTLGWSLQGKR